MWNEIGDSLEFSIEPAFYQTNGFRTLCTAACLALLWIAHQLRLRQLQQAFNMRLEERLEERTRIARELHDTLLQSFQGLMFSSPETSRKPLILQEGPPRVRTGLERLPSVCRHQFHAQLGCLAL